MRSSTAALTRLPGCQLVVVLLTGILFLVPSPASGAGEPDPGGVWPLSPTPVVTARFSAPSSAWGAGHRGVDLVGRVGQTVMTALPGRVTFAGLLAGRGVVVVDDGETRTTYEPVDPTVRVGALLAAGGVIGTLTPTQSHCRPSVCLHWGWIRDLDDTYLDPLRLVSSTPVRLLPLWRDRPADSSATPATGAVSPYASWRAPLQLLRLPPGT